MFSPLPEILCQGMQLPLHTLIVSYPVNLQHETTQYRWIKFNGEGEGLIPILLAQTPGQGTQRLVPRVPGTPETAQSFALLLSFQTLVLLHNVRKQREPAPSPPAARKNAAAAHPL